MDAMFRIVTFSGVFLIFLINFHYIDNVSAVAARRSAIPPDVLKDLKKLNSTADFIRKYLVKIPGIVSNDTNISKNKTSSTEDILFPPDSDHTKPGSADPASYEVVAGSLSPGAPGCMASDTSVQLPKDISPEVFYWPECVTLKRCGGCTGSDLMECAPSEVQSTPIHAMKSRYGVGADGSPIFILEGIVEIQVFHHMRCEFRCKVQPHHCRHVEHVYDGGSCSCKCKNEKDISKCTSIQKWDPATCGCICRQILECHDDEYFSYTDCRCNKINGDTNVDIENIPNDHPCASQNCRAGYAPVPHGSECQCEPSDNWGSDVAAGSIDIKNQEWDKLPGGSQYVSTTTPRIPRPRPTRGSRPRPNNRRRTLGGRGRVRRQARSSVGFE